MPKPSSVTVIGSTGMLGRKVVEEAQSRGYEVRSPRIRPGVSRRARPPLYSGPKSDVVINCAGIIPLRESHPVEMIEANTVLPWQLADSALRYEGRLVHMSTDCVFSGRNRGLRSNSPPDPTDLYGRSKLAGEPYGDNIVVARGSFIGPNHGFFDWLLRSEGTIEAWTKATWNGGSARTMARALVDLAEGERAGIVHVASEDYVTKAWMVEYLVDRLNLPVSVNLVDLPEVWRALEPDIVLPPVKDSLDELLAEEEWTSRA